ncbi:MAG: TonB-dependent receptor, partial [Cyclobacteriaceae bacterium]|nr:TonB-dependent receptor [Cyclobacteriaceae bacterium HetDA_MAG_MS6]
GLFDGQVVGSFEVFRKETEDILIQPTAIAAFGDGASRFVNGASVETTGWEAALAYQGQSGEFTYSISANLSGYRDKITDVPEDLWPSFPGNEEQNIIGQSPDVLFGYRTSGIFQNQAEVDAHADQVGARVGALRFVDLNEDGVINALDQEYGPINGLPDVQYGLNAQVSWKNLDFSMFLWGTIGREIAIDVTRAELSALINGENGMVNTLDAWSPTNTDSHIPAISNSLNPFGFSLDYNVRDGDYLALRQVVLGYTLPSQSLGFVSNARIYVQGENLFWGIKKEGADGYPFAPWRIEDVGNFQTSYPKPLRMTIGFTASF